MNEEQHAERDAMLKAIVPILEGFKSSDAKVRANSIRQFVTGVGLILGVQKGIEIDKMTDLVIAARDSGDIGDNLIDDFLSLATGKSRERTGKSRMAIINELLIGFMNALVAQWIRKYGKPVKPRLFQSSRSRWTRITMIIHRVTGQHVCC